MKVRLSKRAARDIARIAEAMEQVNPAAGRSSGAAIEATLTMLSGHPRIGRLQKGHDMRKIVVPRYGHLIYYRVLDRDGVVAIATVRHPFRARIVVDA